MTRAHRSPILRFCLAVALTVTGCATNRPTAKEHGNLNLTVQLTPAGVSITNKDLFAYRMTKVVLNMKPTGSGPSTNFSGLEPGKTTVIPYQEFTDGDLKRFKYGDTEILTVYVRTEIDGRRMSRLLFIPDKNRPGVYAPDNDM